VEPRSEPKSFMGQPLKSGYQSHYILTKPDGEPISKETSKHYDELVIAQESQVMPIYVVEVNPAKLQAVMKKFQRQVQVADGERGHEAEQQQQRDVEEKVDDRELKKERTREKKESSL